MRDELLDYYDRELTYLRRLGTEFAQRYPKVASRLLLEPTKCDDPHVERLLEGFAFLAARVHLKLDDDFSEVTTALLNVVYPHYVRPIPAMSLVELRLDPEQGKLTTGLRVPRETLLYSRPVGGSGPLAGVTCKFRTCYDTTLWPVTVAATQWTTPDRLRPPVRASDASSAVRLELRCLADVTFASLELETLRLHLSGEGNLVGSLYELLCNNCVRILARDPTPGSKRPPIVLPGSALQPVGFAEEEAMLPYPRRSFAGYRLLQEYFAFPAKFLFLDLSGFGAVRAAGFGDRVEFVFLISPFERTDRRPMLEAGVTEDTVRLGCTPIVNLFQQTSEPVLLTQRKLEYLLVPDARRRLTTEVFSVDSVVGVSPGAAEPLRFEPFHSLRHDTDGSKPELFWYATRRPTGWRTDGATDVYLTFVDRSARRASPDMDAVTARLTCSNGDLPGRLPFGAEAGDFELRSGGPISRIMTLVSPTPVVQPPLGKAQLWRLISQLSLNYLSLVDDGGTSLQEILRLHDFTASGTGGTQIRGIVGVRSGPTYARVVSEQGLSFARGRRVEIDFDEDQFAGGSVYLFASVLERFLALYASLNSFSVLAARTRQRRGVRREWEPRAGWKTLL